MRLPTLGVPKSPVLDTSRHNDGGLSAIMGSAKGASVHPPAALAQRSVEKAAQGNPGALLDQKNEANGVAGF